MVVILPAYRDVRMTELTTGQISSRRFETPYSIADAISQFWYPFQGVWDQVKLISWIRTVRQQTLLDRQI